MINYKISFLIVLMMSVVCFSADTSEGEARRKGRTEREENIAYEECLFTMKTTFCTNKSGIRAIKTAFLYMKLHGDHAFEYGDIEKKYYESFEAYIDSDKIITPLVYCEGERSCIDELSIFEETPIHEVNENVTPSYERQLRGESSSEVSSAGPDDDGIKKRNIMINALYYHVVVDQRRIKQSPNGEAKKYFHEARTDGFKYLSEIARLVQLNTRADGNFVSPTEYCQKQYPNVETTKKLRK